MFVAFHRLMISEEVLERRRRISPGEDGSRGEMVNTIWMLSGDHAQRRRFLKSRADRLIMIRRMVARRARGQRRRVGDREAEASKPRQTCRGSGCL